MKKILDMIAEAEQWRLYHKSRGPAGAIEAAAASVRIRAVRDALKALDEEHSTKS